MAKTIDELKAQSAEVKNATVVGENTATRVGTLFNDIVEHIEQVTADGATTTQKLAPLAVTTEKLADGAVTTEKLADSVKQAIIFDVSSHNDGAVFESLQSLLSSSDLSTLIPTSVRHGGMSIRFIQGSEQSSDNKYVQYRLMAQNFTTDVIHWQGVDDEPTADSDNLVKSGGIAKLVGGKKQYDITGTGDDTILAFPFDAKSGTIIKIKHNLNTRIGIYPHNSNGPISGVIITLTNNEEVEYTATEDIVGFAFWRAQAVDGDFITFRINGSINDTIDNIQNAIGGINGKIGNVPAGNSIQSEIETETTRALSSENAIKARAGEQKTFDVIGQGGDSYNPFVFPVKQGSVVAIKHSLDSILTVYPKNSEGVISGITITLNSNSEVLYYATEDIVAFTFYRSQVAEDNITFTLIYRDIDKRTVTVTDRIEQNTGKYLMYPVNGTASNNAIAFPFTAKRGTVIKLSHNISTSLALYPHYTNGIIGNAISIRDGIDVEYVCEFDILGFTFYRAQNIEDSVILRTEGTLERNSTDYNFKVVGQGSSGILAFPVQVKKGTVLKIRPNWTFASNESFVLYLQNKDGLINVGIDLRIKLRNSEEYVYCIPTDIIGFSFWINGYTEKDRNVTFEIIEDTTILRLHPEKYTLPLLKQYKWHGEIEGTDFGKEPLTLLHFSDIHGDGGRLARIVNFKNHYSSYIDDVIYTGDATETFFDYNDYTGQYSLDYVSFAWWHLAGADNVLFVMGDHDSMGGSVSLSGGVDCSGGKLAYSQKKCCSRFITPFESGWGLTNHPTDKTYWYKDYTDKGIRLIALDNIHYKEHITVNGSPASVYPLDDDPVDTGQQLAWFNNALSDAISNNLAVVVATHSPYKQTPIRCPFMSLDDKYYNTGNLPLELVQAVQTFIDGGGEFITWLTGDLHVDVFATIKDYPLQTLISIDTARNLRDNGTTWSFNTKPINTEAMDCFNTVSFDVNSKFIRMHRIGSKYDRHGRIISSLVYDYANHQLIN